MIEKELKETGMKVIRTPFGWFDTLEIKAKGHPLSRVARIISIMRLLKNPICKLNRYNFTG